MSGCYMFIIDTESYAGNFEREMTAYLTGHYGECGVGDKAAKTFAKEVEDKYLFDDNILYRNDERGTSRPTEIWTTPGWCNDGMGSHYRAGQESDPVVLKRYQDRVIELYHGYIKRAEDIRTTLLSGKPYSNWTLEAVDREVASNQRKIDEAMALTKAHAYGAYLSVAIFFSSEPTEKQIEVLKSRALKFAKNHNITVTGFRLLEEEIIHTKLQEWSI